MTSRKYAIVNDVDCPTSNLVTQIIDGKHYYMSRYWDKHKKRYDGMTPENPSFLEDFGFNIIEREYQVDFCLVRASRVTYKDGKIRDWQGPGTFSLPVVNLK